jgi:hypothetical protein
MPVYDERNILCIGPPQREGDTEITPAMADTVRQRIQDAGGKLLVWAVLHEDRYETLYGDGFYIHVRGIAPSSKDAHTLAELAGESEWVRWHIKGYELGLENGQPAFLKSWSEEEEFRIGDSWKSCPPWRRERPPPSSAQELAGGGTARSSSFRQNKNGAHRDCRTGILGIWNSTSTWPPRAFE